MFTYSEILGNERIIRGLKNAAANGTASHAYIFGGAEGIGKRLVANTFAKALQCEHPGIAPCDGCVSCRAFNSGNHPDVIYLRPETAKSIGIDRIRDGVNGDIAIKPYRYRYKIYIVESAEKMTVQAQNAILKTIEEPEGYGVFLLTSSNLSLLLPTVLSRTVVYRLKPLPSGAVADYLASGGMDMEKARFCANYAQGNIGRALTIAGDESFAAMRSKVISALKELKTVGLTGILKAAKELEEYKESIGSVLDIIEMWYRDIAVFRELRDESLLLQTDIKNDIRNAAKESDGGVSEKLGHVMKTRRYLSHNSNFLLTVESLLLNLSFA